MDLVWCSSPLKAVLLACALPVAIAGGAHAKVFHSRQEAVELAFPGADRIESETYILDDAQVAAVEKRSRAKLETRIVKVFSGFVGDETQGYALIDLHQVRTLPEAFLIVLTPEGRVRSLRVVAFHEPLDYMPSGRWYEQFEGRSEEDPLRVGSDIHGIAGATLSARATTEGVRRALALYHVLVKPEAKD